MQRIEVGANGNATHVTPYLADADWVLGHFTLAANLTALQAKCFFSRSQETVVARYDGLPFAALSFFGESPAAIAAQASQLVQIDEIFYVLLNEEQTTLAKKAFVVEQVTPEWQMRFTGELKDRNTHSVASLSDSDLEQMRELAAEAELMALEEFPFAHGPAFGIHDGDRLVAMGCTRLQFPHLAEIGNIATRKSHRRRGLARRVVNALLRAHASEGKRVFLMVFQTNQAAVTLYENMGFERLRPMFLLRCRLRESHPGGE